MRLWPRRHNLIRLLLNSNRGRWYPQALRVEDLHQASEGWPGQPDHPSGQMFTGLGKHMKAMGWGDDGEARFSERGVLERNELRQIRAIVDAACAEGLARYSQKQSVNSRWRKREKTKMSAIQRAFNGDS